MGKLAQREVKARHGYGSTVFVVLPEGAIRIAPSGIDMGDKHIVLVHKALQADAVEVVIPFAVFVHLQGRGCRP